MRLLGRSGNRSSTPSHNSSSSNHTSNGKPSAGAIIATATLERPASATPSRTTSTSETTTELSSPHTPTTGSSSCSTSRLGRSSTTSSSDPLPTNQGAPRRSLVNSSKNKPVDLDDIYDGKLDLLQHLADLDDSHHSDDSVGDVTETSASKSSINDGVTTPEDNRMSALVHTMAEKQQVISETFFEMIGSMTKLMLSMEEQMLAVTTCTNNNNESHIAKAQARAHRNVQKALEMQENALAMKTKQARIAQQFETLVHRLEQESLETSLHNQSLQRQLQMARVLLRDEAGVEMEDISNGKLLETNASSYSTGGGARTLPRRAKSNSSTHPRPPLSSTTRRPGSVRSSPDGKTTTPNRRMSGMHPIKEIAFANTVVDVTEMSQAAAEAEDGSHSNIHHDNDNDFQHDLVLKESNSSDEFTPRSQRTSTTVMTSTTGTTVAENLRFLL